VQWPAADAALAGSRVVIAASIAPSQLAAADEQACLAAAPAGVKEKSLIGRRADGALIFQGAINDGARRYLDRTTLEPKARGEVRQLIEVATDDGRTWTPTFDASYRCRR
jgi:hypothetical protein